MTKTLNSKALSLTQKLVLYLSSSLIGMIKKDDDISKLTTTLFFNVFKNLSSVVN